MSLFARSAGVMKLSALASALLLPGCATVSGPRGDLHVMPAIQGEMFRASDGTELPLRQWDAQGKVRAVLVALHGMNDYSNAFDQPARLWAASGITTLAYDQRGFGRAPDPGAAGPAPMRCAGILRTSSLRHGRAIRVCRFLP